MPGPNTRMRREHETVESMIRLYCRGQHGSRTALCPTCQELADYAHARLDRCPFQERKTVCARCPVHCYQADMRERIREVMRYAGPRMLFWHPFLALWHLVDRLRSEPLSLQADKSSD